MADRILKLYRAHAHAHGLYIIYRAVAITSGRDVIITSVWQKNEQNVQAVNGDKNLKLLYSLHDSSL